MQIALNEISSLTASIQYGIIKARRDDAFGMASSPLLEQKGSKAANHLRDVWRLYFYFLEPKLRPSSIATNAKEIIMQNREIISKSDMTFTSYAFVEHQR